MFILCASARAHIFNKNLSSTIDVFIVLASGDALIMHAQKSAKHVPQNSCLQVVHGNYVICDLSSPSDARKRAEYAAVNNF